MTSQLFYVWLPDDADADAREKAAALLGELRSATVVIEAAHGVFSVNVKGSSLGAAEAAARIVITKLRGEGGFRVGRNLPVVQAPQLADAEPEPDVKPPPVEKPVPPLPRN